MSGNLLKAPHTHTHTHTHTYIYIYIYILSEVNGIQILSKSTFYSKSFIPTELSKISLEVYMFWGINIELFIWNCISTGKLIKIITKEIQIFKSNLSLSLSLYIYIYIYIRVNWKVHKMMSYLLLMTFLSMGSKYCNNNGRSV